MHGYTDEWDGLGLANGTAVDTLEIARKQAAFVGKRTPRSFDP